jgi:hypothetical protein
MTTKDTELCGLCGADFEGTLAGIGEHLGSDHDAAQFPNYGGENSPLVFIVTAEQIRKDIEHAHVGRSDGASRFGGPMIVHPTCRTTKVKCLALLAAPLVPTAFGLLDCLGDGLDVTQAAVPCVADSADLGAGPCELLGVHDVPHLPACRLGMDQAGPLQDREMLRDRLPGNGKLSTQAASRTRASHQEEVEDAQSGRVADSAPEIVIHVGEHALLT